MYQLGLKIEANRADGQSEYCPVGGCATDGVSVILRSEGRASSLEGGNEMLGLDSLDILFIVWAFFFQIVLVVHFAVRKRFFESYTLKFGWVVYALSIPAVVISVVLLLGGKTWSFWLGGFLFLTYAAYGYWVDYVKGIPWRKPLHPSIAFPYVLLYLATVMFY
jgi:hypothetical protein